jgi:hypothetical protein
MSNTKRRHGGPKRRNCGNSGRLSLRTKATAGVKCFKIQTSSKLRVYSHPMVPGKRSSLTAKNKGIATITSTIAIVRGEKQYNIKHFDRSLEGSAVCCLSKRLFTLNDVGRVMIFVRQGILDPYPSRWTKALFISKC